MKTHYFDKFYAYIENFKHDIARDDPDRVRDWAEYVELQRMFCKTIFKFFLAAMQLPSEFYAFTNIAQAVMAEPEKQMNEILAMMEEMIFELHFCPYLVEDEFRNFMAFLVRSYPNSVTFSVCRNEWVV